MTTTCPSLIMFEQNNTFVGTVQGIICGEDGLTEKNELCKNNMFLNRCTFFVRRLHMKDMYNGESLKNPNSRWLEVQHFDFIHTNNEDNDFLNDANDKDCLNNFKKPYQICHDA